MSEVEPSSGGTWRYQFSLPDGVEVETGELDGDDAAATRGRELSASHGTPIVVHRHSGHVDAWEYLIEVDATG